MNLLWTKVSPLSPHGYPPAKRVKRNVRRILGSFLSYIQDLKLYRKLIKDKICYSITVGDDAFFLSHPYCYNEHPKLRDPTEPFRRVSQ